MYKKYQAPHYDSYCMTRMIKHAKLTKSFEALNIISQAKNPEMETTETGT
jgi:hypothetical protein